MFAIVQNGAVFLLLAHVNGTVSHQHNEQNFPEFNCTMKTYCYLNKSQSCIYSYKDNLTGTTNRSYTEIQGERYG